LKLQRKCLESQYQCISMKLSWSTANLDPVLMAKFYSLQSSVDDRYAEARITAGRVLDIVKDSTVNSNAPTLYHSAAVRATTLLLQILLQTGPQDPWEKTSEIAATCREGLLLCRSLVPSALAKAEETIEGLLNRHLERLEAGQQIQSDEPSQRTHALDVQENGIANFFSHSAPQTFPFQYPFDNTSIDSLFHGNFQDPELHFGSPQFPDLQFDLFDGQ